MTSWAIAVQEKSAGVVVPRRLPRCAKEVLCGLEEGAEPLGLGMLAGGAGHCEGGAAAKKKRGKDSKQERGWRDPVGNEHSALDQLPCGQHDEVAIRRNTETGDPICRREPVTGC